MTRADELLGLAERVEALTGPDREVDAEIAVAVSGDKGAWVVGPSPQSVFAHQPGWYRTSDDKSHQAPPFTASLDAAMSLVPKDRRVSIVQLPDGAWGAAMLVLEPSQADPCLIQDAKSAALALTAAALRALAAIETGAAA